MMLDRILEHLRRLVAFDSTNPPRAIPADHPMIEYAAAQLRGAGMEVTVQDLGEGSVNVFAVRGRPTTLLNCHLDTVPADPRWERDPFDLLVEDGRATGLGACDIKGAAACMLAALEASDGPAAVLFSTDEEGGQGKCVDAFCKEGSFRPRRVLVAEPTGCRAVTRHRGLVSCELTFTGKAAHTSIEGATAQSALHRAVRWAAAALELEESGPLANCRFNLGVIQGGVKGNVTASSARVVFGLRPPPEADVRALLEALDGLRPEATRSARLDRFVGEGLDEHEGVAPFIDALDVPRAPDVEFWTEASIFGAAGIPTIVCGPGDISQAHTAGESVPLDDLERAAAIYARAMPLFAEA